MRKSKAKKNIVQPDPKFGDVRVTRFVNDLMHSGKKSIAFDVFYNALELVEKKTQDSGLTALEVWKKALENITPAVEVKSRRDGGATFQVPMEIRPDRKISIGNKTMIGFARKRTGRSMREKLAAELLAALNAAVAAFKKKEDTHRMAEANRAFAHFRF